MTFGNVSGNGLLLGNTLDKSIPWYASEGWASAWSVVFHHHRGNAACVVSFGKGNLGKVAQKVDAIHRPDCILMLEEQDV